VLAVIPFDDEAEAIAIGNDVIYGLAAAVWTKSLHRAMLMTDKLKAGHDLGEQLSCDELHVAVRRLQEFRHRTRIGVETIKEFLHTKCVWISTI
jgi:aldehyde dehydrogenase (NAD+)